MTHWVLHQGWCPECGCWKKAQVPTEHATGYGPRFSALMGEVAGTYGNGRRMVQTFCASVLRVPGSEKESGLALTTPMSRGRDQENVLPLVRRRAMTT